MIYAGCVAVLAVDQLSIGGFPVVLSRIVQVVDQFAYVVPVVSPESEHCIQG